LELVPFKPIDGPDNQYGQLHKPINAKPYKEAGIKGFIPPMPFKPTSQLLTTDQFHWLSLSELNNDLFPFHWSSKKERKQYLDGNLVSSFPPPSAPTYNTPMIPSISSLTTTIIRSADKLFFISNLIGSNEAQEWRLVRVAFQEFISLYPLCLQDGRFLVEFYICHPAESWYNAVNQRFWLQYHTDSKLQLPLSRMETHLIYLSASLIDYATCHELSAFQKWMNLTH
jgi:hypothetical protein